MQVQSYWPGLFAKLAEKRNIEDLVMNCGGGGGGAVVAAAPAAAAESAAAAPAEEKKVNSETEQMEIKVWFFCVRLYFVDISCSFFFTGRGKGRER